MGDRILKLDFIEKKFKKAALAAIIALESIIDLKIANPNFILDKFKYLTYYLEHTSVTEFESRTKFRPMYPHHKFFEDFTIEVLNEYKDPSNEDGHILIYNCDRKTIYFAD